jgi:signal transduction histidine kinase
MTTTGELSDLRALLHDLQDEPLPGPLSDRLRALENRLNELGTRLAGSEHEANLARAQFISVVSHELRLPMTSIKGYTDLILQGTVGEINPRQREFLEIVRSSVDRMDDLVSDLLDISRIETGRIKLDPAPISLAAQMEQVLKDLRPGILEKRLEILVDLPAELPRVYADPVRVNQVLENLIENARKFTREGGSIRFASMKADGFVRTEVRDTGIGISPEDQARLFEPFFRSEAAAVREQSGWGLGLNVARNLVRLMGGEIGVESELGSGSVFWFTLPIDQGYSRIET